MEPPERLANQRRSPYSLRMSEPRKPPIQAIVAPVTPLQQNCTIVWCAKTRKAAVIDPGGEVPRLLAILADQG
jgi:glyoxylase-like metal-dependent hydrolase (beta-lactamase superfamily II)